MNVHEYGGPLTWDRESQAGQKAQSPPFHGHKDVHILILRACGYVTLHGKMDVTDVTKVKDPEMRILTWLI